MPLAPAPVEHLQSHGQPVDPGQTFATMIACSEPVDPNATATRNELPTQHGAVNLADIEPASANVHSENLAPAVVTLLRALPLVIGNARERNAELLRAVEVE